MDWESTKIAISAIAALISILGAATSLRVRRLSRLDLFEAQKDQLVHLIYQSNERARFLAFQSALLLRELELNWGGVSKLPKPELAQDVVEGLKNIERFPEEVNARAYDPSSIRAIKYSEHWLQKVRELLREEKGIMENISNKSFEIIFSEGVKLASELSKSE
jgi:hypothetical protein